MPRPHTFHLTPLLAPTKDASESRHQPREQPMKITQVKVRLFEMPMPRPFHPTWQFLPTTAARIHVVEVHTDEGIVGIGSGGVPVRWEVAGLFLAAAAPQS